MKALKIVGCIVVFILVLNINLRVSSGATLPNGSACTTYTECDSNFCVDGYCCNTACLGGVCDACSVALGAVANGVCTPRNGVACSDGNACTGADICQNGACLGQTMVDCGPAPDQCHNVPTCNPPTGVCSATNKPNGTACNDNNPCTTGDSCQSGACMSTPVVCPAPDQCHTAVTCDMLTGLCPALPAKADGTACNDGNACTQTDTCQSGVCTGSNPVTCPASDQCHAPGVCNTSTGVCSNPARANGTACNDGNLCTTGETCQNGTCMGGTAVVCTAPDQCHLAGNCDIATGICINAPAKVNGAACNDGNACTKTDTCQNGTCIGGNNAANGTACNDGNACTQTDTCQGGTCTGSNPIICTALDQCHTAGTCNPATGTCSNPNAANGTACNDGNACTQTDICQTGVCSGSNPVTCLALDLCHTVGVCNPASGLCSNPENPYFKIEGGSLFDAASFVLAYDIVQSGQTLQVQGVNFTEDAVLQQDRSVVIRGGYACDFLLNLDFTHITGSLTVGRGSVLIENFVIQ